MKDIEISLRYLGNGKFQAVTSIEAEWCECNFKENELSIFKVIKWTEKRGRTKLQNNAIHLWLTKLAKALNDAGLDMRKVLKPETSIDWTMQSAKDYLWRPVQKIMTGKKSTTKLETKEVSEVAQVIDRKMMEKGINIPFPNYQNRGFD